MSIVLNDVSTTLEQALVVRASAEKKSVDRVAVEILENALGVAPSATTSSGKKRDLSFLSEGPPLEPEVLEALAEQRQIDSEMWK
jgi:hypothetical protein